MSRVQLMSWLLGVTGTLALCDAHAQRLKPGDMVEFRDDSGTVVAEILSGPDPSHYYMLGVPGREYIGLHPEKLRVLQRVGSEPDAAFNAGDSVTWRYRRTTYKGALVRVNGAWCHVKAENDEMVGWIECKGVRSPM